MSVVGNNLRRVRLARNFTQQELADKINRNPRTISNWERGTRNPSNDELRELARILDVPPAELIGHNETADYIFQHIVTDDDMSPEIVKGDTLTINRAAYPEDGDLVIVETTDKKQQMVRRLYRLGRMLSLIAINPTIKPLTIDKEKIKIKGKVTELRRKT